LRDLTGVLGLGRFALLCGAIMSFLAVALGAFGAHALENVLLLNGRVATYETANQYHFYHAFALLLQGVLARAGWVAKSLKPSVWLFLLGTVTFSGSLYILAVTDIAWMGAITPLGGLMLLIAWGLFAKDLFLMENRDG